MLWKYKEVYVSVHMQDTSLGSVQEANITAFYELC